MNGKKIKQQKHHNQVKNVKWAVKFDIIYQQKDKSSTPIMYSRNIYN